MDKNCGKLLILCLNSIIHILLCNTGCKDNSSRIFYGKFIIKAQVFISFFKLNFQNKYEVFLKYLYNEVSGNIWNFSSSYFIFAAPCLFVTFSENYNQASGKTFLIKRLILHFFIKNFPQLYNEKLLYYSKISEC